MERPEDLPSDTKVGYWYWGSTGAGKTHAALAEFPDPYRKIANNKWWDGYQDEENVLIDDLDKKHEYMGYHLKIWADRYAFIAETKGSSRYCRPKRIIVTSNYHPKDIWGDTTTLGPLLRRFKVVRFLTLGEGIFGDQAQDEVRQPWVAPPILTVPSPISISPATPPPSLNTSFDLGDFL